MRLTCGFMSILYVVLFVGVTLLGGYCVDYTLTFWGTYLKGTPPDVPFPICCVIGLLTGELAVPVAAITWGLSFVL